MKIKLKYSILSKIPFMEILSLLEKENIDYSIVSAKEDGRSLQFEDNVVVTEAIVEIREPDDCRKFVETIDNLVRSRYDKETLLTMVTP